MGVACSYEGFVFRQFLPGKRHCDSRLVLAFIVESPFIGRLKKEIEASYRKHGSRGCKAITYVLRLVGVVSLAAAVVGEVGALAALVRQSDS